MRSEHSITVTARMDHILELVHKAGNEKAASQKAASTREQANSERRDKRQAAHLVSKHRSALVCTVWTHDKDGRIGQTQILDVHVDLRAKLGCL